MFNNLFKKGLQRSKQTWFGRVKDLFNRPALDENVWTELEEILIAADVGVNTTEKLITTIKQRVKDEQLKDSEAVRSALKEEMIKILNITVTPVTIPNPPKVTLVVGVNGGGKTTSIGKLAFCSKAEGRTIILVAADTFTGSRNRPVETVGGACRCGSYCTPAGCRPGSSGL